MGFGTEKRAHPSRRCPSSTVINLQEITESLFTHLKNIPTTGLGIVALRFLLVVYFL